MSRELAVDRDGRVLCQVVEVTARGSVAPCADRLPGRAKLDKDVEDAVREKMENLEMCNTPGGRPCEDFFLCKLTPAEEGDAYESCLNDVANVQASGYCYIDGMRTDANGDPDPLGNPALVSDCPETKRRLLRIVSPTDAPVNERLPWPGSTIFVACQGAAYRTDI